MHIHLTRGTRNLRVPPEKQPFELSMIGVELRQSDSRARIIDPLPWRYLSYARLEGVIGGPLSGRGYRLTGKLTNEGLMAGSPDGPIQLIPYSEKQLTYPQNQETGIICLDDRHVVYQTSTDRATILKAASSSAVVYDRLSGKSQTITVPGSQSRLRLFGPWLAAVVVEPPGSRTLNPGSDHQRKTATASRPAITTSISFH